jgi:prophage regulatory protein
MTRKMDPNLQLVSPSSPAAMSAPPRVLRLKEVCKMVGLGRSFVYRLQTENRFPHSIKIGVRAVGWLEDEVRTWLAERIANSRRDKPNVN